MGWFYGLKLHLVINHKGSIVTVKITPGNVDERALLDEMTQNLKESLLLIKGSFLKIFLKNFFKENSN
jgi:IS5 family transposase